MEYVSKVLYGIAIFALICFLYFGGVWKDGGSVLPVLACGVIAASCVGAARWIDERF